MPALTSLSLLGLAGAAGGLAWGWWEAGWVRLRELDCPVAGLPSELAGLRVAHLSDFHLGVPSRGERAVERAADWVAERRPDLTCVTGDLLSRRRGEARLRRVVERLPRCHAVLGNHDFADARDPLATQSALEELEPAALLRDESRTLELRGRRVQVVGVDPRSYRRGAARPEQLADPRADLRILLCHFPGVLDKLPPGAFHLVLAGHLHAGQIVLPYGLGRLRLSQVRWTYVQGLYRRPAGTMHVSPGLGTTFVPFRFFARPEATELVLRPDGAPGTGLSSSDRVTRETTGRRRTPLGADRELEAVKRFPEGNPNPVLQLAAGDNRLLYANPAAAQIVAALGLRPGDALPEELAEALADALRVVPSRPVELQAGERTFSVVPVEAPELGVVNLYATDITAARVLERFPDWNPNPVLRMSRDGTLLYANDASAPITRALRVRIGERLPSDTVARLLGAVEETGAEHPEVQGDGRHYSLVPVLVPELGTINVYGTDVTALRAIDKFPDENPNPVLRITRDGRLQYANPASRMLTRELGLEIGEPLPVELRRRLADVLAAGREERLEVRAGGRTFELLVVSVYEFDFVNLYGTDVTAARAIEQANRENERLLLAILPPSIAERLRSGETAIADSFDEMSVLFADLVGFTELSSRLTAAQVVRLLNDLFSAYDELADRHGLEKIKTIGDAYMAVGGLTEAAGDGDHVERVAETALAMVAATERIAARSGHSLQVRVGVHTGPTVAGVIGMRKFIYDVWGDAVNQASRMESHGLPGRIQVTETTYRRLSGSFSFERRGAIDVKGLGRLTTYFLVGRKA